MQEQAAVDSRADLNAGSLVSGAYANVFAKLKENLTFMEAVAKLADAAKNLTAAELRMGENWCAIRSIINNRHHWNAWVRYEAPKFVPGATPETISKQIKAWETIKDKPRELRNIIVERGVRPTQFFMEELGAAVEQEGAGNESDDAQGSASHETREGEPGFNREVAEKVFTIARERYDSKIAEARSAAGRSGGRGKTKGSSPKGLSELRLDAYEAIRAVIERIDSDAQHDWLLDLVCLCFGSGLGETTELTFLPRKASQYHAFKAQKPRKVPVKVQARKLRNVV